MDIKSEIQTLSRQLLPEIIEIRRYLHQNPELSFNEVETAVFICKILDGIGISYTTGWAGHGIVGTIRGKSEKVIALRADMDALPIQEQSDKSYISKRSGVMHACGHDAHMSALLGASMILKRLEDQLPYTIRLIFQPGEEKLPGGASMMIEAGVLQNPVPECIIGQHVYPSMETGKVGVRPGLYMASADEIYITVEGKGGHAAMPHECVDTILAASQLIVSLQQLVSRHCPPAIPSVLSFGKFNTIGGATNIIPDAVKIEGTFRTMDEKWRCEAHERIQNIAGDTAASYGARVHVQIIKGYPCLVNNETLTIQLRDAMEQYSGKQNVEHLDLRMTSEDFAFYSHEIPACFYRLGTGNVAKSIYAGVHTPTFDIDEDALETGMGMLAWLAISSTH